MGIVRVII